MSKPTTRSKPASRAALAMPTIPPAGPDRMASAPRNWAAPVSAPLDCMNMSRVAAGRAATASSTYRRRTGER